MNKITLALLLIALIAINSVDLARSHTPDDDEDDVVVEEEGDELDADGLTAEQRALIETASE